MNVLNAQAGQLAELMGDTATHEDAEKMRALLELMGIQDTDELSDVEFRCVAETALGASMPLTLPIRADFRVYCISKARDGQATPISFDLCPPRYVIALVHDGDSTTYCFHIPYEYMPAFLRWTREVFTGPAYAVNWRGSQWPTVADGFIGRHCPISSPFVYFSSEGFDCDENGSDDGITYYVFKDGSPVGVQWDGTIVADYRP